MLYLKQYVRRGLTMKLKAKNLFMIAGVVFLLYLAIYYWPGISTFLGGCVAAATPVLAGFFIAYVVNIIMCGYERIWFPKSEKGWVIKSRRPVCITFAFVTLVAIITVIGLIIVPQFSSCITMLFTAVPKAVVGITDGLVEYNILPEDVMASVKELNWQQVLSGAVSGLTSSLGTIMNTVVSVISSVVGGVIAAFLGIIFSVYMLVGKDRILGRGNYLLKRFVRGGAYEKVTRCLTICNQTFRGFIIGQSIEAVILGVLCFVGMTIFGFPYAGMISTFIAFTALIPIAGAYIGGIVGGLMIFSVSPIQAILFGVFLIVLQQLEGNLIYPKVVGTNVGLPSLWVLVAVTVGGSISGFLGMLLGVPLAASVYKIAEEFLRKTDPKLSKETQKE